MGDSALRRTRSVFFCASCGKSAWLKCGPLCGTRYCSEICKIEDWTVGGHSLTCAGVATEDAGTKLFTLLGIDEYDPMAHVRPNKPNA